MNCSFVTLRRVLDRLTLLTRIKQLVPANALCARQSRYIGKRPEKPCEITHWAPTLASHRGCWRGSRRTQRSNR